MKFSDRSVAAIKPTDKQQEIPDSLLPGLYLRVMPSGVKSWAVRYRANGKQRRLSLGKYPAVSLAAARDLARTAMKNAARGVDVQAEKMERRKGGADDIAGVIDLFIERHAKQQNRTWKKTESILKNYALKAWKGRKVEDITRKDVIALVDGVHAHAPIMANRVLAAVRKMFNWCVGRDLIQNSPAFGVTPPAKERKRNRILSDEEIKAFWQASEREGYPFGDAFRLMLITGQRREEVIAMRWSEIDLPGQVWEIPGSRTKNEKAHRVPLGPMAIGILKKCPKFLDQSGDVVDFVFPASGNNQNSISGVSRVKARIETAMRNELQVDSLERWTLHDLRRTFASGCRRAGVALDVVEKMINHISGSFAGVVGVYQLHDYEGEKREAVKAWEGLLRIIIHEKNRGLSNAS